MVTGFDWSSPQDGPCLGPKYVETTGDPTDPPLGIEETPYTTPEPVDPVVLSSLSRDILGGRPFSVPATL